MATSSSKQENQVQIKVSGDLGDFEITEDALEETDSEDDEESSNSLRLDNGLSTIPQDLVKQSVQPVFGSVQVTKSENVQFGNNVYFNGPVVIKQVVHTKEQDNPGYEQTEDDAPSQNPDPPKTNVKDEIQIRPLKLKLWLKLSFSAICVIIVAGICTVVTVMLTYTGQENATISGYDDPDTSTSFIYYVKVEGCEHLSRSFKLIIIFVLSVLITLAVWGSKLLTKISGGGENFALIESHKSQKVKAKKKDEYNVEADPLLIAPTHLRIVSRIDWLAQPVEKPLDTIRLPVPWVIIQHTATESCHTQRECVLSVRLIQMFHVESRGWYDIGYNFLVAGDGSAYFGRGWEYQGAHTLGYNKYSMGIAFIGTFNNEPPPKKQLDACKKLIQKGVELGKIAKDYKLFGHRQLASTLSPGDKLFDILKEWPHFVNNFTDIEELLPNY